jgi:hypothetical protein
MEIHSVVAGTTLTLRAREYINPVRGSGVNGSLRWARQQAGTKVAITETRTRVGQLYFRNQRGASCRCCSTTTNMFPEWFEETYEEAERVFAQWFYCGQCGGKGHSLYHKAPKTTIDGTEGPICETCGTVLSVVLFTIKLTMSTTIVIGA